MDNGSSDGTREFFERFAYPYPLTFTRNPTNDNVIATLNRAWRLADTEFVCLLHNDTEMVEPAWLSRLLAALAEPGAGLAGLYGAKRLRADGRLVGRTIVHSLLPRPTVRPLGRRGVRRCGVACASRAGSSTRSAAWTRATASFTASTASCRSPSPSATFDAWSSTPRSGTTAAGRGRAASPRIRSGSGPTSRFATRRWRASPESIATGSRATSAARASGCAIG